DLPHANYGTPARQAALVRDLVERLSRIPGAQSAGAISWAPMGLGSAPSFRVLDRPVPPRGPGPVADRRMTTPRPMRHLGGPVLRGRDSSASDTADRPRVVLVNRALAQEFWPGQDPIGKRVNMPWNEDLVAEVVGVVGDVRLTSLDTAARHTLYWPQEQVPNSFMTSWCARALRRRRSSPPCAPRSHPSTRRCRPAGSAPWTRSWRDRWSASGACSGCWPGSRPWPCCSPPSASTA